MNPALYSHGSLRHLKALTDGTLPKFSLPSLKRSLKYLTSVFEIICLRSFVEDFCNSNFDVGYEYNERVVSDIEVGVKWWSNLTPFINPTCLQMAQRIASNPQNLLNDSSCINNGILLSAFRKHGCQYVFLNHSKSCKFCMVTPPVRP